MAFGHVCLCLSLLSLIMISEVRTTYKHLYISAYSALIKIHKSKILKNTKYRPDQVDLLLLESSLGPNLEAEVNKQDGLGAPQNGLSSDHKSTACLQP